jgi:hypothetical protein
MHRVVVAAYVLAFGISTSISGLEPLRIVLDPVSADGERSLPAGIEARYFALFEDAVFALARYDVQSVRETAEARLEFRVVDFIEERVWVPDEDGPEQSDADDGGRFLDWFARVLFGWATGNRVDQNERGQWMYDASLVVSARLIPLDPSRASKRFTLTAFAGAESMPAVRTAVLDAIAQELDSELRRLFILRGIATSGEGRSVSIDLGGDLGVERGAVFRVDSPDGDGSLNLVRAERVEAHHTVARVVRQYGTDDATGIAQELVDNPADLRADLVVDLPSDGARPGAGNDTPSLSASLLFVLAPYAPFHGGGGIRIFSVEDSRLRQNAGFGIVAFGGLHLVRRSRVRAAVLLTGGADFVFRPDDAGEPSSTVLGTLAPGAEVNVVLSPNVDAVVGAGYRLGTTSNSWWIVDGDEDEQARSGSFDGSSPAVSTRGPYATIGLRYCFF